MSGPSDPVGGGEQFSLGSLLRAAVDWADRHQEEIAAFRLWGTVEEACEGAGVYAPADYDAWQTIAEAARGGSGSIESVILDLYAPGGDGYAALVAELHEAPLLEERQSEVDQVIEALAHGWHYLAICGALPLVEGTLATAYGKWQKRLSDYPLQDRLDETGGLDSADEAELLLNVSAIHMLDAALPEVWKSDRHRIGTVVAELNRHLAVHGTAQGWDTRDNAVRSVLLLAAAARVAGPLLSPQTQPAVAQTSES